MRSKKLSLALTVFLLMGLLHIPGLSAQGTGEGGLIPPFAGTPQEWESIAYDEAAAANGLLSLKAVQTGETLHVAIEGEAVSEGGVLYIDSDNDASTGWGSALWSNGGGIDYKVEDGLLHRYESGDWTPGSPVSAAHEEGFAEFGIGLSELGLAASGKLRVGYVKDGASMLPEMGGAMLTVDAAAGGVPASDGKAIAVDGDPADWAGLAPLAATADGSTTIKANIYDRTLYMLIEGQIDTNEFADGLWEHILIDTDRNPATGSVSWAWASTLGADFLVQSGSLFKSSADGGWSWSDTGTAFEYARSGKGADKVIEWAIPLEVLGLDEPTSIHVAFLTNTLAAPDAAGDPAYVQVPLSIAVEADGDPSEWAGVEPLAASADDSTKVYAHVSGGSLHMLIRGQIDTNEFADGVWEHLLIDTDRNPATGGVSWAWANTLGSEYLVQSGLLYESAADGGWAWDDTGTAFDYARAGTGADKIIEWSILLDVLGLSDADSVNVAFLSNTQAAPDAAGDPATIALKATSAEIVVDGQEDDWADIAVGAAPSGLVTKLRAVRDDRKLYTLVSGSQLNLDNDYFLDSDGNAATGYQSDRWPDDGMDYKVSGGILYAYDEGEWEQRGPVYTNVTSETAEMYLYLSDIGATMDSGIKIGYAGRDMLQLPLAGDPALTVDSTVAHPGGQGLFYPKESFEVLNNPYAGWVPWAKDKSKPDGESYAQPHSLVYAGISWRELEPVRGQFDWAGVEEKYQFDFWTQSGKRINLRIVLDLPTSDPAHMDIPDWLYDSLQDEGDAGVWYDTAEIGAGFSPNYNSGLLLEEHERLIAAVAERYNDDPRIAYIQLGSLGHWGEWHTWPAGSGVFPYLSVSDQYVGHYLTHFTDKKIGMRKPFPIANENSLGLFNDVFGIKSSTNEWLGWTQNGWAGIGEFVDPGDDPAEKQAASAMPDFWKYSFSGGEFAEGNPAKWLRDDAIMETLRQTRESHTSWLGPAAPSDVPLGSELQRNIDAMHKLMGYRFVLEAAKLTGSAVPGGQLNLSMLWNNKGVAPFYFDWPLQLRLVDGSGRIAASTTAENVDIRQWLPGRTEATASLKLPGGLSAGSYALTVAILDPETGEPGIRLANEGRGADGGYLIGQIQIAGGGSGGGGGGGESVAHPTDELHVDSPAVSGDGKFAIEIAEDKTKVIVPLSVWSGKEQYALGLQGDGFAVELPAELIAQLSEMAGADSGAKLMLHVRLANEAGWKAAGMKEHASLEELSRTFVFGLSLVKGDGERVEIGDFAAPVRVELTQSAASASLDASPLSGVFRLAGGLPAYAAGVYANGRWTFEAVEPGAYAVLLYDKRFADMPHTHWALDAVKLLAAKGIVKGAKAEAFAPDQAVTRAEFAALVARALGLKEAAGSPFGDVGEADWYRGYAAALHAAGIVSGKGEGRFEPDALITREEIAVIIVRALNHLDKSLAQNITSDSFADANAISDWAVVAVQALADAGYLHGYPDTSFKPGKQATRAEAAQLLQRLLL
ncbi:DUF4832 domain-containing protein [Paenibacillus sp. 1011MAR3C5]|uniref:S-layer homology domain-containing protein n=1 Tax=Paenibacillus sp. 1011MAR3C5 TaxID=1675787 RepID=UPI000E6C061C|nr:S-layer homology domain-containing protein [Paenibacillus sp. 1011MAR3C5]RJE87542.1 DUF4832 domain-containing protein [Paenibacillus sp. 1011MAR3C5]